MVFGSILIGIGVLISLVYYCILLSKIFLVSRAYGWLSLYFPVIILVFLPIYWEEMGGPFIKMIFGLAIMYGGFFLIN